MRLALIGALRLARGDRSGLSCFVASTEGFWRSFRAALICYPLYVILLHLHGGDADPTPPPTVEALAVETIAFVVSWTGFPLLVLPIAGWLGRDANFLRFAVAYNWCHVPQTVLLALVAVAGAGGALPTAAAQLLSLAAALAVLAYEWYVARVALEVTGPRAALVVLADIALDVLLTQISEALY